MVATLSGMAKKQNKSDSSTTPPKKATDVVRIEGDLARMAALLSTATGDSVSDILSPMIRPQLEKRYAAMIKQLGEEVEKKAGSDEDEA